MKTRRLVEQRNALFRPGTLRCRYDHQNQSTIFTPSRQNKRSWEELAEIVAELMRRAIRKGGGYQPIQEEPEKNPEGEIDHEAVDTEEDSKTLCKNNLPIVDLSNYNTDRKEAKYIQINHIVRNLTTNKKTTEKYIKKGLVFVDDQIVVPIDIRRWQLDNLNFGHSGIKRLKQNKTFWWPEKNDSETKIKDCTACLASGKSLKCQIQIKHYGKLENLTEPGQETQIDFTGK